MWELSAVDCIAPDHRLQKVDNLLCTLFKTFKKMKRVHFHAKMQRLHYLSDMTIGSVHLNKKQILLLLILISQRNGSAKVDAKPIQIHWVDVVPPDFEQFGARSLY
jgi:hypothetical protein